METIDEKLLISQLANPATQRRAFERVVRQYGEQLYCQARRIVLTHEDADDVVQNSFIKAWNGLSSFHGDSKLITWLTRIVINESLDWVRRNKNVVTASGDDDTSVGVADMLMADKYFDGERAEALLHEAISQLPSVQRTVFQLRYFDEMKYSEISRITGTSEGGLKASYHIAVKKITEYLKAAD